MSDYYENGAGNRTPTYQGDKNAIWKELRKLWVRIEGSRAPETPPLEKAWSWSDIVVLTTAVDGQPWSAPCPLILSSLQLTLLPPGSAVPYTVVTVIGGVDVESSTLGAGETNTMFPIQYHVQAGQTVWPRLLAQPQGTGSMMGIVYRWEQVIS